MSASIASVLTAMAAGVLEIRSSLESRSPASSVRRRRKPGSAPAASAGEAATRFLAGWKAGRADGAARRTDAPGLAPLSGSTGSVGVVGYTLGGGLGWLARRDGFVADSVLHAEVVTSEGRPLAASATRHPDLFWALRGGGGNFGAVTSLEFRLYPVARVYGDTAYFGIDRAAGTLRRDRDWVAAVPDDMSTAVLLTRMPEGPEVPASIRGSRALAIKAQYVGDAEHAERLSGRSGRLPARPCWTASGRGASRTRRWAAPRRPGTWTWTTNCPTR